MSTAAQIKANRENGKKSHGPVSEAGKQASCMNNVRHGLAGGSFFFLQGENPEHYDQLHEMLEKEHEPKTGTEFLLVEKMARAQWMSQRALYLETINAAVKEIEVNPDELNKWARYQMQHERAFEKALNQLLKLREARRKEQIGFESEKAMEAERTHREQHQQARAEHDQLKTEILKQKREREQSNAVIAAMKASKAMERELGPEGMKMMAQMMEKQAA